MKDTLVESIEMNCPICGDTHIVEKRLRETQALFKGEIFDYEEVYFLCDRADDEENEFVPAKVMDLNLLKVRDSYRISKGLLTSYEIADIRLYYGLTQSEFAAMLGWGEITVTRYESKTIQDETYDSLMRMVRENSMLALEYLDKHAKRFTFKRYSEIRQSVKKRLDVSSSMYLKMQEVKSLYTKFEEASDYNGFKILDIDKLTTVIGYYANEVNHIYKVKMMKLLWYTDALYYKRYGKSMTGLVYEHMTYGALPIGFNEILSAPTIQVVEEMMYEDIGYKIVPTSKVDKSIFTKEELSVLELVVDKFKDYRSKQIVDYMHGEKAYIETSDHELIPFSLAKELKELS
ncbi:DUF4065 domain-containing protein [Fusibacter bizertensis]|uniref:DUF4065 domain-containing protein n=1 Tax=Fusibacter bizertensis TaxID=1488331 RepID=A0ABT6NE33_9FIRM|nr:type II TA system antitoxin MqsA family protein [Fusibacter bizertensis]MDH8678676.1 DUF4065 domain-containing protein [Fusibacter bizertensis]